MTFVVLSEKWQKAIYKFNEPLIRDMFAIERLILFEEV